MPRGPLFRAVRKGDVEQLKKLLASGIKPDSERLTWNDTPLMNAARNGRTDCVIELIKAKAKVNRRNMGSETALILAARYGHTGCVIELTKAKANLDMKANWGQNALSWAREENHHNNVRVLEQARDDFEGFLWAHMAEEEKSNACRREYGRVFALASRVTKSPNSENIIISKVQKRLPPDYEELIQFFSRNPGLVKWTGTSLLLYFNTGSHLGS